LIGYFLPGSRYVFDRFESNVTLLDLTALLWQGDLTAAHRRRVVNLYLHHVPLSSLLSLLALGRSVLNPHSIHVPFSSLFVLRLLFEGFGLVFRSVGERLAVGWYC